MPLRLLLDVEEGICMLILIQLGRRDFSLQDQRKDIAFVIFAFKAHATSPQLRY